MDYLAPAWHNNLADWAYSVPHLDFDDADGLMRLLQNNDHPVGLLLFDYQPTLLEKLSQLGLHPARTLAVFDYIQDIHHQSGQILTYNDFRWPRNARFEFGIFHMLVRDSENRLYAMVIFSTTGRILSINYYDNQERVVKTQVLDSRGFVSREETFHPGDKKPYQIIYFDETGQWRINHNPVTDQVIVNPLAAGDFAHTTYSSMDDLVREVALTDLMPQIYSHHDRLVISADDQSPVNPELFRTVPIAISVSQWHPYKKTLDALRTPEKDRIVTDRGRTATDVQKMMKWSQPPMTIPLFYSQFKLGHSQRIAEQIVAIFSEHLSPDQLMKVLTRLHDRLLKHHKDEHLLIIDYSSQNEADSNAVVQQFCAMHTDEFRLHKDRPDMIEVKLDKEHQLPEVFIKVIRLASVNDALRVLDHVRLMIDLSDEVDEFLQMSAVSIGIPRLQKYETAEVQDHRNGLVVHNLDEMMDGISFYLDHLKNWNNALAADVQVLNKYSSARLYARWQRLWKQGER